MAEQAARRPRLTRPPPRHVADPLGILLTRCPATSARPSPVRPKPTSALAWHGGREQRARPGRSAGRRPRSSCSGTLPLGQVRTDRQRPLGPRRLGPRRLGPPSPPPGRPRSRPRRPSRSAVARERGLRTPQPSQSDAPRSSSRLTQLITVRPAFIAVHTHRRAWSGDIEWTERGAWGTTRAIPGVLHRRCRVTTRAATTTRPTPTAPTAASGGDADHRQPVLRRGRRAQRRKLVSSRPSGPSGPYRSHRGLGAPPGASVRRPVRGHRATADTRPNPTPGQPVDPHPSVPSSSPGTHRTTRERAHNIPIRPLPCCPPDLQAASR